jgi:Zn-dependent protease
VKVVGSSLQVGHIAGVPVLLHWTLPIGIVAFTGGRLDVVAFLSMLGLVLIHELGHVFAVKASGARPESLTLTGYGGEVAWRGEVSGLGSAFIAAGGIFAQLVVFALAMAALHFELVPVSALTVINVATFTNVWLMAFNLLPVPPLDGAEAWKLPYRLGVAARRRLSSSAPAFVPPVAEQPIDDEDPAGVHAQEARSIAARLLAQAREEEP